jgi:DNA helicase II / ATP-dependent DNA helicase PcrA
MGVIKLNKSQQEAVDHIYGPLLVLAGPGTGKTQLLSARIANILTKTDVSPQNILCLTFTENASQNMRERLASIIKDDAYDVHINTYHGFGSDIIRSYPEFFEEIDLETGKDTRLEHPIDDLQRIQIIESIVDKLPYDSPLIGAKNYTNNVVSIISELKRGLINPNKLRSIANQNIKQINTINPNIEIVFEGIKRMPSKPEESILLFTKVQDILEGLDGLAELALDELNESITKALTDNSSKPLTAWKNAWLSKNSNDTFVFGNIEQNERMLTLAEIYEKYDAKLAENNLYDFDDMILRTINALETKDDLRFNLQEKYQFILLDEFQDTNASQFELVKQLANNPVNEGQPNIFAVGDDDQAIYAFQGAKVSNMLQFTETYKPVKIINLTENYRSHPDILHTSHNIAKQIESRLHHNLDNVEKTLTASADNLPKDAIIERHEFASTANEDAWVADRISKLINEGVNPKEIAILAPKHALLEQIVPFLSHNNTPVAYEKREDILQTPLMRAYKSMINLIIAAQNNDESKMNELFPQVLSLDFYELPVKDIWKINWAYKSGDEDRSWAEIALDNYTLAPHVLFYLHLGLSSSQEPLEYVLDYIIGSVAVNLDEDTPYTSPLKAFYFSDRHSDTLKYYELLTNLSTIREHIRTYQQNQDKLLSIEDFIDFLEAYETAQQPLINSHPIAQAQNSVQLMTVYKAKGLEFEHVFLLSVHDDIWGKKARGNNNKLALPANLQHIRYQGSSEDELRRILFVAITRAKYGLYLTSHATKDNGKTTEPVKYLLEYEQESTRKTTILPQNNQSVLETAFDPTDTMKHVELLWESRHLNFDADLKSLLKTRLANYQMSPTHLNSFIDLQYSGPESFLLQSILRFPQAPGNDGEYGNAFHSTLEWYQNMISKNSVPAIEILLKQYDSNLAKRYIAGEKLDDFRNKGHNTLKKYIEARKDMFEREAITEVDFRREGVLIENAHLAGKIDRLEIDKANKTVNIVDFKTGKPHTKWDREIKLLKYKQQLYFYKFLIEGSHTWSNYKVAEARLEFVEPDANGKIVKPLTIAFDSSEEKQMKLLIKKIWNCIQNIDLPDTSEYEVSYTGVLKFIDYLTNKK